jgi:hypothetical protein
MLNKCGCGRYTNYGSVCVSCAMAQKAPVDPPEIDLDDLFMDEDAETTYTTKRNDGGQ